MRTIYFTERWDKLKPENVKVGMRFTTVRKYTEERYASYHADVGKERRVVCMGTPLGKARIISLDIKRPSRLTLDFIRADTFNHYNREDFNREMVRFYGRSDIACIVVTAEWTEVANGKGGH